MLNVIFLGLPGSGKGTQASIIADKLGLDVCAIGDVLRLEQESGSELGLQIKNLISKGELVPLSIILDIIRSKISNAKKGLLFDGIPRNLDQAEALDKMMHNADLEISAAIEFQIDQNIVLQRLKKRYICANCSSTISVDTKLTCSVCGSVQISQRDDDVSENAIKRRIEIFEMESKKIIEFYKMKNILRSINADQHVKNVTNEILSCIKAN